MISNAVARTEDAVVARGQRAWSKIETTAAEQRQLWREVGEALAYGRLGNPANQKFGHWCKDMGFDMDFRVRNDAMWLAGQGNSVLQSLDNGLTHPTAIRQYIKKQEASSALPEDLKDVSITTRAVPTMDDRTAEKVGKLVRRAASNDEGSEIAKRHLESVAKTHGVSSEDLTEAASIQSPASFYQFTPAQLGMLQELKSNVEANALIMESSGFNREAIAKVFVNVAQNLLNKG
jgi:hypothetical protein